MQTLHDNPFYDFVFAYDGKAIPSTRTGYKNVIDSSECIPNPESANVHSFRAGLRESLSKFPQLKVPFKGRVLVAVAIGLTPQDYASRDIDNMVKSLLDALKTVVYDDDRQVDVLHVAKFQSVSHEWSAGIKMLPDDDPLWHFPPLYLESPMGR